MYSIGIYQNTQSGFSDYLCQALHAGHFGFGDRQDPSAQGTQLQVQLGQSGIVPDSVLDLCVLESAELPQGALPGAQLAVVPDLCKVETVRLLQPKSIVTYGLSCKNTVTVSSFIAQKLVVSIQREIKTLSGISIPEQEFSIHLTSAELVEAALASVTVLLLLDTPIPSICRIFRPAAEYTEEKLTI